MAKPKRMKGVTCKNGYWYARVDRHLKYCGKGEKGRNLAEAARKKWEKEILKHGSILNQKMNLDSWQFHLIP